MENLILRTFGSERRDSACVIIAVGDLVSGQSPSAYRTILAFITENVYFEADGLYLHKG